MSFVTSSPIRIYVLAKQLNLPTERLVGVGRRLGMEVNGLCRLDPGQRAAIENAVRERPPGGPDEPPCGVTSKLPPHRPRSDMVRQESAVSKDDEGDAR